MGVRGLLGFLKRHFSTHQRIDIAVRTLALQSPIRALFFSSSSS
jgi:hypothetical protein